MNNYILKEFYGKETISFKKLCAYMFRTKFPELENEEEFGKKLEEVDKERGADFFRLGAFHEGALYGAIEAHDYNTIFDGNIVKATGIGGVVSDFNSPYKGAVKEIFKRSFEIMREKKQYISHLNPFEESYYRQFGYDVSTQTAKWRIPIEKLGIHKEGIVKHYDGSDKMKQDIKAVFNAFTSSRNLVLLKSEKDWTNTFDSIKPYVSGNNTYVHYNTENIADGYMNFKTRENKDRPQDMVVSSIWFSDFKGLRGILSYFEIQKAYCDHIELTLPADVDISAFVNSTGGWGMRNTVREVRNKYTTRVVDVEEILKIAKYKDSGKVCIKITDNYAPWNNDCFTIEFGKETKIARGGEPDAEMTINSFSSAILGRYSAKDLPMFPDVKIIRNMENLEKVFYNKPLWFEGCF